jgi:uncharacterized protein (UPF0332 family)
VKPETTAFLEKAREFLAKAQDLLDAHHWPDEAGRASYLAGFHAAQAFVFENTGKVAKSHKGLQTEFARLVKDDPRFNMELRGFLGRAYNLKTIADYETGSGSPVSPKRAAEANQMGRRFVECVVASLLSSSRHSPDAEPKP